MSDEKAPKEDYLIPLTTPTENGEQVAVRYDTEGSISFGVMGKVRDGQPIPENAEILALEDSGQEGVMKVTSSSKGPAKVNSAAYRANYDSIFGVKTPIGSA